jgi:hypothetical protein
MSSPYRPEQDSHASVRGDGENPVYFLRIAADTKHCQLTVENVRMIGLDSYPLLHEKIGRDGVLCGRSVCDTGSTV